MPNLAAFALVWVNYSTSFAMSRPIEQPSPYIQPLRAEG